MALRARRAHLYACRGQSPEACIQTLSLHGPSGSGQGTGAHLLQRLLRPVQTCVDHKGRKDDVPCWETCAAQSLRLNCGSAAHGVTCLLPLSAL